ncbi:MAG: hypothetical protein V1855_02405 [bacterium]
MTKINKKIMPIAFLLFGFTSLIAQTPPEINTPNVGVANSIESALRNSVYATRVSTMTNLISTENAKAVLGLKYQPKDQQAFFHALIELFNQRLTDPTNRNSQITALLQQASTATILTSPYVPGPLSPKPVEWIGTNPPNWIGTMFAPGPLGQLVAAINTSDTYTPEQLIPAAGIYVDATLKNEVAQNAAYGVSLEAPVTPPDPGPKPVSVEGYKWEIQNYQWVKIPVTKKSFVGYKAVWDSTQEDWVAGTPVPKPSFVGYKTTWDPVTETWIQGAAVPKTSQVGVANQWNSTTETWNQVAVPKKSFIGYKADWNAVIEDWIQGTSVAKTPQVGFTNQWNSSTEIWDKVAIPKQTIEGYRNEWNAANETWNQIPVPKQSFVGYKATWNTTTETWIQGAAVPLPTGKTQADVDWDATNEQWIVKISTTPTPAGQKPASVEGYKWEIQDNQWLAIPVEKKSFTGYNAVWDTTTENWIQGATVPLPTGKTLADVYWDQANEQWRLLQQSIALQPTTPTPDTKLTQISGVPQPSVQQPTVQQPAQTELTPKQIKKDLSQDIQKAQQLPNTPTKIQAAMDLIKRAEAVKKIAPAIQNNFSAVLMDIFRNRKDSPEEARKIFSEAIKTKLLAPNQQNYIKNQMLPLIEQEIKRKQIVEERKGIVKPTPQPEPQKEPTKKPETKKKKQKKKVTKQKQAPSTTPRIISR